MPAPKKKATPKPPPAPTEHDLADVIYLRDPVTQEDRVIARADATPDEIENAVAGAKERKAIFVHRIHGAEARAGLLPRTITAALSAAVVNHVFAKILQDELVPATAKEAAEVAKAANEVYKLAAGVVKPEMMTESERREAV